jgi:SET family sugar efflux transporter-like MFS transporter
MNVFRLCFAVAWTGGPALGALIVDRYSFRASFLAVAGLQTLFILVVAIGVRSAPPSGRTRTGNPSRSPLLTLHRIPGFLPHFLAMTLILSCTTISMMNLPLLMVETLGGRPSQVGIAYSIAPFFELPLMWYIGIWAGRIAPVRIIRYAAVLAVVFYGSLALVTEPWHVYPLQLLSAAMVAVTSGIAITFFQDFLPGQAGTATDLYGSAGRIGAISGYLLCGFIGSELGYRSVFAVCAILCASAWMVMMRWRPEAAMA